MDIFRKESKSSEEVILLTSNVNIINNLLNQI